MIKILLLFFAFCIYAKANSQNDSTHFGVGFIFAPQAKISLKNVENGSTVITPFFITGEISRNKISLNPFYNLFENAAGCEINYQWFPKFGSYITGSKNVLEHNFRIGIGLTTPVVQKDSKAFLELERNWEENQKTFFMLAGIFIPLMF